MAEYYPIQEPSLLEEAITTLFCLDVCCVVCKVKGGASEFPVQRSIRWPSPSLPYIPYIRPSWKRP